MATEEQSKSKSKSKKVATKAVVEKPVRGKKVVEMAKPTKKARADGILVPYFTATGEKEGTVSLPKDIFGQKPNKQLLAQAVRVYLSNQRRAGAKTKGRGEVSRTTKKVYRQKGTGGARHGARSAPLYVGGGIAHGPRGIENYELSLPRSMRRKAILSAFSVKAQTGTVAVADLDKTGAKTGKVAKLIKKIGMPKPLILYKNNKDLYQAGRNIEGLSLVTTGEINIYQVLATKNLILTKDAIEDLKLRYSPKEEK